MPKPRPQIPDWYEWARQTGAQRIHRHPAGHHSMYRQVEGGAWQAAYIGDFNWGASPFSAENIMEQTQPVE